MLSESQVMVRVHYRGYIQGEEEEAKSEDLTLLTRARWAAMSGCGEPT